MCRFPCIGRHYLDNLPQSAEALTQRAMLPVGTAHTLREYLHGNYLMLYTATETDATVYPLPIRHHRQFSFDFAHLWPAPDNQNMPTPRWTGADKVVNKLTFKASPSNDWQIVK